MQKPVFIVTGPESSGKSTLSKELSELFNVPMVKEYARDYIDSLDRDYEYDDLKIIASEQWNRQREAVNKEGNFVICDTGQLVMKIWSEWKYNQVDNSMLERLEEDAFYILCKPDIPWEYDEQRENPDDRDELFELYLENLREIKVDFIIVEGDMENRRQQAIDFINKIRSKTLS